MTKQEKLRLTDKWYLVVSEYEKIKSKKSDCFEKVEQLCKAYQVTRKDVRKYYMRWVSSGKNRESLLPKKRGPKPGSLKILSKDEERTILQMHRRLGSNEFEIYELIAQHRDKKGNYGFSVHPSVSTIYRTFKRFPLNKKRKEKIKRYEKKYPGELLHADTCVLHGSMFLDGKKRHLFGVIDDCTRLCYVELIKDIKAATVSRVFFNSYRWFYVHGIKVDRVMTDNGGEFTAYTSRNARDTHFFETMLNIFKIKHSYTKPYTPQTNGKIERFWKTIKQECIRLQADEITDKEFVEELNGFMYRYNYERMHGGINYITPFDKLKIVSEIMK